MQMTKVSLDYVIKRLCPKENIFFSSRCHISDIDVDKLLFKSPSQDKLATPFQAPIMH